MTPSSTHPSGKLHRPLSCHAPEQNQPRQLRRNLRKSAVKPVTAAAARSPAPEILIEIDRAISCGVLHDRFDMQLRSRVVSSVDVEEVELLADGGAIAKIQFGQTPAVSTMLADGTTRLERACQFILQRPLEHVKAPCQFVIRARTGEGQIYDQAFELAVDPTGTQPVTVVSGPSQASLSFAGQGPPLVLYVEQALLGVDRRLMLNGWVVALSELVKVRVFVDEDGQAFTARTDDRRDDVEQAYSTYPGSGTSGFSLSAQVAVANSTGPNTVRVQAICRNECSLEAVVALELATSAAAAPPAALGAMHGARSRPSSPVLSEDARLAIHYHCDEARVAADGTLTVTGWATCAVGIAAIGIYLDREKAGDAELMLPRPDVGEEFPNIPLSRLAGFAFAHRIAPLADGVHEVRIVVRNSMDGIEEETRQLHLSNAANPPPGPDEASALPTPMVELEEFRFHLETPKVLADKVVEPITGRLTIEGWALAGSSVSGIDVYLDGQYLGAAHYGLARQDVSAAFPEWANSLHSGFAFHCPPRLMYNGAHELKLIVKAHSGEQLSNNLCFEVARLEENDEIVGIRRRITRAECRLVDEVLRNLDHHPHFQLLLRSSSTVRPDELRATIDSVRTQTYPSWQLSVLAAGVDTADIVRTLLTECVRDVRNVTAIGPTDAEFDAPIAMAEGNVPQLYGVICPGDELGCDALAEFALASGLHRGADFLYGDEACYNPANHRREPFFKPDFSPDLLLSTNYIGHPWFAASELVRRCDVTPRALLAAGEYDIVLRLTEEARAVHHLPKLLAKRGPKLLDDENISRDALARTAKRRGFGAEVVKGCLPGTFRLKRVQPATGKVSIIIPTCAAHGHVETCIRTIREKTAYGNYEIVCIDNAPDSEVASKLWLRRNADQVIDMPGVFNWSKFNNRAVDVTDGDYLLFMNDDIEIVHDDWLEALLEHAQRPEVGIVGPLLLYPSRDVQHAGVFLGVGVGRHAFRFSPENEPGYFGLGLTQRNVIAVTGACMLMRRSLFEALGRFDEAHPVINNDLDFCLRAHRAGKLTVFTPHARLIHYELGSRDQLQEAFDFRHFQSRWTTLFAAGDPYFSPRLSRYFEDYRPDCEPTQMVFAGQSLFRTDEIRCILVVLLDTMDHIATAMPAIRRLKSLFPHASIDLLACREAHFFVTQESCIHDFIEFEPRNGRPDSAEVRDTGQNIAPLAEQLASYRFDIAVDLCKHPSTREFLRGTGARFLAGFDYKGQFSFLDIALEWDGDKARHRKRSHVMSDLIALVDRIGAARETEPASPSVASGRPDSVTLPTRVRALFDRPVVVIHPGASARIKRWPQEHFIALIELLLERDGVNVLLIGRTGEHELVDMLIENLRRPERVASMTGPTSLTDLQMTLGACALYIGNEGALTHAAAELGVPTISIHSGVSDAIEWGPIGARAVALQRNMTCAPCYLANADDCPRGLACLRSLEPSEVHRAAQLLLARRVIPIATEPVDEEL